MSLITLPSYLPNVVENVETVRDAKLAQDMAELLRGHGFTVRLEEYICGFWLVHWKFPRLKLVK